MKFYIIIIMVFEALLCSCADTEKTGNVPQYESFTGTVPVSLKGYEMYSWKEGSEWTFTLITGTNRQKTRDEITSTQNTVDDSFLKVTVRGVSEIKSLLDLVPTRQSITWISNPSRVKGFSMPPSVTVADIQSHCESLELDLRLIK